MTDQTADSSNETNKTADEDKKPSANINITYGEVDLIADTLSNAQALPKQERVIQNRKEIINRLKSSIVKYLKKGYSTLATAKFINSQIPSLEITDDEVRALLHLVTKKRKSSKKSNKSSNQHGASNKKQSDGGSTKNQAANTNNPANPQQENKSLSIEEIRGQLQAITLDEKIYLEVPFDRGGLNPEKDKVKELGAIYEPDTKWHVKPGDDIRKFLEWLSAKDFKRLTGYGKP